TPVIMAKVKDQSLEEEVIVEEVEGKASINDFITQNQNLLIVAGLIVLAVIAGLVYMFSNQGKANEQANADMFKAIYYFEQDSMQKALNGDGVNYGFLDVIDDHSGTATANAAKYYAGVAYLKLGQVNDGLDMLESVSTSGNTLGMSTYIALGFAYEDQGDYGKAASNFEKAATTPAESDNTTPLFLQKAGENYEANGDIAKARKLYQKIKDEYPTSQQGSQIDKYLGRVAE
ncbi:MAG: tetratricopeptide repeat protein, partial [Bacteroidota bacterium]